MAINNNEMRTREINRKVRFLLKWMKEELDPEFLMGDSHVALAYRSLRATMFEGARGDDD